MPKSKSEDSRRVSRDLTERDIAMLELVSSRRRVAVDRRCIEHDNYNKIIRRYAIC